MCKKDEYRSFAALCLAVATKTSDTAKKARLLGKAAAWLDLAGGAGKEEKLGSRG